MGCFSKNVRLLNMSDQAREKKIPHIICPQSAGVEFDCPIELFSLSLRLILQCISGSNERKLRSKSLILFKK